MKRMILNIRDSNSRSRIKRKATRNSMMLQKKIFDEQRLDYTS
jgi:hypothetical protein